MFPEEAIETFNYPESVIAVQKKTKTGKTKIKLDSAKNCCEGVKIVRYSLRHSKRTFAFFFQTVCCELFSK